MLGIGSQAVYSLEVDDEGKIIPDRIPALFARVEADGRRPMALVANACSTAVGLYDPLAEIAEACRARGVWLHVDGAHGASALLEQPASRASARGGVGGLIGVGRSQAHAHADTLRGGPGA